MQITAWWLLEEKKKPYTEGLGLENIGITPNQRGQIEVNDHLANICSKYLCYW